MSNARVTAVIPLHNHEDWVADAVGSIANQTHRNITVVVVDDGSTDGSVDVVKKMGCKWQVARAAGLVGNPTVSVGELETGLPVILARYETGHGPSFARNRGIELALGAHRPDYIAFLDSDDMYEQEKVTKSLAVFDESGSIVGAVYSDYETLRPDGLRIREFREPFSRQRLSRECIVNCDSIVRVDALKVIGTFDETLRVCEDYDFWLRLSDKYLISHMPESLVTIRVGQHSSSSSVPSEIWQQSWRRVMEKAQARMARPNG